MRHALAPLVLSAALAGCVYATPVPPEEPFPPADAPASCGADGLQGLVGQDRRVLETLRFSQPLRVIAPGTAVTMDFSPFRLNIETEAAGRITRVYCG